MLLRKRVAEACCGSKLFRGYRPLQKAFLHLYFRLLLALVANKNRSSLLGIVPVLSLRSTEDLFRKLKHARF